MGNNSSSIVKIFLESLEMRVRAEKDMEEKAKRNTLSIAGQSSSSQHYGFAIMKAKMLPTQCLKGVRSGGWTWRRSRKITYQTAADKSWKQHSTGSVSEDFRS